MSPDAIILTLSPMVRPPCPNATPEGFYPPLHAAYGFIPTTADLASDGVTYYWVAGEAPPIVPTPGWAGHWNFPAEPPPDWYTRTDATALPDDTGDFAVSWGANAVRVILVGDGTATLRFGAASFPSGVPGTRAKVYVGYDGGGGGLTRALVFDENPIGDVYGAGETVEVELTGSDEGLCIHVIDIEISGGDNFFGWGGTFWVPA
jgi:hypothetical protein